MPPNDGPPEDELPPPKRRLPLRYLRYPDQEPEPEDFLPSPPQIRGPMTRRPLQSAFRPALLCFIGFWIASILHWRRDASLWVSGDTATSEWWRLFTALFTHSDLAHLAANTPLFLIFGWFLRAYFGLWVFPAMAFVVGAVSNLWTVSLNAPVTRLVGASGMLYGMVAMWLVLYIRFAKDYTVPMRIFRAIGVSLVLLFPTTFDQNTSYTAHATGFAVGLLVALLAAPFLRVHEECLHRHPEPVGEGPPLISNREDLH